MSAIPTPNPGREYIVRELLGQGAFKDVYRAVYRGDWKDRALAMYREDLDRDKLAQEVRQLILHKAFEHVARVYGLITGEDGHLYLVEELLYRPLDRIAPVTNALQFIQIARDLCFGLDELHSLEPAKLHRDLKLDNCGIDHSGRAKLFDLGSITDKGGDVTGTVLTRSPELFDAGAKCSPESDMWALGALLFALRGLDYPFVSAERAKNRPRADREKREQFRKEVEERMRSTTEQDLKSRVETIFPEDIASVVAKMLKFNPSERLSAFEATGEWEKIQKNRFVGWSEVEPAQTKQTERSNIDAKEILSLLRGYVSYDFEISTKQWQNLCTAVEKLRKGLDEPSSEELTTVMDQAKRFREALEEKKEVKLHSA